VCSLRDINLKQLNNPMEPQAKAIRYEFTHLRQEFLENLNDFSAWVQTEKLATFLGSSLLKQVRNQENQIRDRLKADFSLVIIGDFKRGKSTLINALLEMPVVTTNVTPETVTINEIKYGSELRIDACLVDGGRVRLETEELQAEQLVPLLEKLPQKVSHLSIKATVEWLRGLCLVDTPGTGDIFKQFDSQVHAYLYHADAVLFVVSALVPLAESEQAFLRLSLLPQDFPKLFFVVNMMDIARTEQEAERLSNSIKTKISRVFPNAYVFGLSALDEVSRIQSLPRPNPNRALALEADFKAFRECLQKSILLNRDLIQLDRATTQMEQMLQEFESKLKLLQHAIQSDQLKLSRAIAQCEDESSELFSQINQHKQVMRDEISQMREQACYWINEFMERLETEAIATIPNFKLDDIRRHFHFFLTDSLRKGISQCLDAHRSQIIESANKANKAILEDFHLLTEVSLAESDVAQATFGDLPWTNLDTIHLLMEFSPFKLFAHLLIGQAKESEALSQTIDYKQKLQKNLPELRRTIAEEIRSLYSNIADKITAQIETAYRQDIEASVSAMRQAQELSTKGEEQIAATNQCLQEASLLLTDTYSSLKSFKQKLWSETVLEN